MRRIYVQLPDGRKDYLDADFVWLHRDVVEQALRTGKLPFTGYPVVAEDFENGGQRAQNPATQ
jgi:hypothetical protein